MGKKKKKKSFVLKITKNERTGFNKPSSSIRKEEEEKHFGKQGIDLEGLSRCSVDQRVD